MRELECLKNPRVLLDHRLNTIIGPSSDHHRSLDHRHVTIVTPPPNYYHWFIAWVPLSDHHQFIGQPTSRERNPTTIIDSSLSHSHQIIIQLPSLDRRYQSTTQPPLYIISSSNHHQTTAQPLSLISHSTTFARLSPDYHHYSIAWSSSPNCLPTTFDEIPHNHYHRCTTQPPLLIVIQSKSSNYCHLSTTLLNYCSTIIIGTLPNYFPRPLVESLSLIHDHLTIRIANKSSYAKYMCVQVQAFLPLSSF